MKSTFIILLMIIVTGANLNASAPIVIDENIFEPTCNGSEDGNIFITVSGGSPGYTYVWSTGSTSSSIFSLAAGTYGVTVTDSNGSTVTEEYNLNDPDQVTIDVEIFDNISCEGENDGHIKVNGMGGTTDSGTSTVDYYYEWSSGQFNTNELNNLSSGSYTVTVSDFFLCSAEMTFTISDPSSIFITFPNVTNPTCSGSATGTIELNAGGGTGALSYSWSNGATGNTISNIQAGNYTVTISDENNCTFIDTYTLTDPPAIQETEPIIIDLGCFEDNSGEIEVFIGGGTGMLNYSWSNGGTSYIISNLAAGDYFLTIEDANDCIYTNMYTVSQPDPLAFGEVNLSQVTCNGDDNGSIELFGDGGASNYSYSWSNGSNSNEISNLSPGTYIATLTDGNNCTFSQSFDIIEPAEFIIDEVDITNVDCTGNNNGAIALSLAGGSPSYTYIWSTGGTSNTISNLAAGQYSVTVTDDNGCTDSESYTISEPSSLQIVLGQITDVDCNGSNTGSIEISVSGGSPNYEYAWSTGGTSNTISNLTAGLYFVTVTDDNGCTNSESYTISEPASLQIVLGQITDVDCNGSNTGSIEISALGGSPNYEYTWSTGSTVNEISNAIAGTYSVTVSDQNNCSLSEEFTITEPEVIEVEISIVNVDCGGGADGSISITSLIGGTGEYDIVWSNGETSNTISNLETGDYSLTITDDESCEFIMGYSVSQPGDIEITSAQIDDNICASENEGSIALGVSGGLGDLTFEWSTGETSNSILNLSTGGYSVTITDENGCNLIETFEIASPDPISTSSLSVQNVKCNGDEDGVISFLPMGGVAPYIIEWTYLPQGQTNPIIVLDELVTDTISQSFGVGTIDIKIIDANDCITELNAIAILEPSQISYTVSEMISPLCNGDTDGLIGMILSGGSSPYSIEWTYMPIGGGEDLIEWTYNISDTTEMNFGAGIINANIIDQNGCLFETETFNISEPEAISYDMLDMSSPECNGDTSGLISMILEGGASPYAVKWSYIPTGQSETFVKWSYNITDTIGSNFGAGIVSPTIMDNNGCELATETISISEPDAIGIAALQVDDALCISDSSGMVSFEIEGGIAPYIIEWTYIPLGTTSALISTNEYSQFVQQIFPAGLVTGVLSDANGCSYDVEDITIGYKNEIVIEELNIVQPKCGVDSSGIVQVLLSGGSSPYAIEWTYTTSDGTETFIEWTYNITDMIEFNFGAGIISGLIEDANGCQFVIDELILSNTETAEIEEIKVTYLEGLGNIELIIDDMGNELTFSWIGPDGFTSSEQNIDMLDEGIYSCVITDENGCQTFTGDIQILITSTENIDLSQLINVNTIANRLLVITNEVGNKGRYYLLDLNGQNLQEQSILRGENYIDVQSLPPSIYIVAVHIDGVIYTQMISKI